MFLRLFVVAGLLALATIGARIENSPPPDKTEVDMAAMDRSAAPGDDFYQYVNGSWLQATAIPPDKPAFGVGTILADETRKRTVALIQEAATRSSQNDNARKIGDFYASFMDETGIEAKSITPLQPQLDAIASIGDRRTLARMLGATLRADVDPLNNTNFHTSHLFGVWVTQGLDDPERNYAYLLQGGLGMPDREYYLSNNPKMTSVKREYSRHVATTLKLAGFADEQKRAERVLGLESKMATIHATRVDSQDVHTVTRWQKDDLPSKAPGLDWATFLKAAQLSEAPVLFVWQPRAVTGLSALVASEPLEDWKDWLAFHLIDEAANFLPSAFVAEHFSFHGKALNGIPQLRERWQRGVDLTSAALGEAVGKLYVARYFPPEVKAKLMAMVDDLKMAFGNRIDSLEWMSKATKSRAKEKLATLIVGVGYPDQWRDYSLLEVSKGDALGNMLRAQLFEYRRQLAKLHQPIDRHEWWMTPQTVNAVNLPLQNALNFPAAILQPPFFDPASDNAQNYGAIGAIIGHEISHSFDDQGSQFDSLGRLVNWWTKDDFEHFKASGEALAAQYNAYHPFPDLAVNGHLTLSENIADLAGLAVALDAYALTMRGKSGPLLDGFTGEQRFFIAFGQAWRNKMREAALRNRIATDGHAPALYRAATVRNLDAWYTAFSVMPNQKMYLAPKDRVRVW
jgi:predicted metalloendopeptidase